MSQRDTAHELLGHYLTQGGSFGDKLEAADAIDALLAAAVEMVEARGTVRSGLANLTCTLRDLFAAKAMQGLIAGKHACFSRDGEMDYLANAEVAYGLADAMLAARKESPRAS